MSAGEVVQIRTLWGKHKWAHPGDTPELLFAQDEFTDEANPDRWAEESAKAIAVYGDDLLGTAELTVEVPYDAIHGLFETPVTQATVAD